MDINEQTGKRLKDLFTCKMLYLWAVRCYLYHIAKTFLLFRWNKIKHNISNDSGGNYTLHQCAL